jgi:hypothetical protein
MQKYSKIPLCNRCFELLEIKIEKNVITTHRQFCGSIIGKLPIKLSLLSVRYEKVDKTKSVFLNLFVAAH